MPRGPRRAHHRGAQPAARRRERRPALLRLRRGPRAGRALLRRRRRCGRRSAARCARTCCGWRRAPRCRTPTGTRSSTSPTGRSTGAGPGAVPVIGRHGRPDPVKWPRDPGELLQAYPDSRARSRSGSSAAARSACTGSAASPASWDVVEFGAESPRDFLGTLDFFVYFHDPDWVEAFGRTILEAMASGVPVIVGAALPAPSSATPRSTPTRPGSATWSAGCTPTGRPTTRRWPGPGRFVAEHFGSALAPRPARLPRRAAAPGAPPADQAAGPGRTGRPAGSCWSATTSTGSGRSPAGCRTAWKPWWWPARPGWPTRTPPACSPSTCPAPTTWACRPPAGPASSGTGCATWSSCTARGRCWSAACRTTGSWPRSRTTRCRAGCGCGRRCGGAGAGGEWAARGAAFAGILEPGEFAAAGDEGWTTTARAGVTHGGPDHRPAAAAARRHTRPHAALPRRRGRRCPASRWSTRARRSRRGGAGGVPGRLHELPRAARRPGADGLRARSGARRDDELARARFAAAAGVALCATDDDEAGRRAGRLADPAPGRRSAAAPRTVAVLQRLADWTRPPGWRRTAGATPRPRRPILAGGTVP